MILELALGQPQQIILYLHAFDLESEYLKLSLPFSPSCNGSFMNQHNQAPSNCFQVEIEFNLRDNAEQDSQINLII